MTREPELNAASSVIEERVTQGRERIAVHTEALLSTLDTSRPGRDSHAALLALETLLSEGLHLSAWLMHLRGQHEAAHEIVHAATSVQRAVSDLLARE